MKLKSFALLCLSLLSMPLLVEGCASKWERKLSETKFVDLLVELYSKQTILMMGHHPDDTVMLAMQQEILSQYGLKDGDLDSILSYYGHYKADRLAKLTAKAAEKVQEQLEYLKRVQGSGSHSEQNYLDGENKIADVSQTIPKGYFPAYAMLSPYGDRLVFLSRITDSVPKGRFSVMITLKPLNKDSLSAPAELLLAYQPYYAKAVEKTLCIYRGGSYTLELPTDSLPAGRLTTALYSLSDSGMTHLYVEKFDITHY